MEHIITIRLTDDKAESLPPEVDDVIAIAKKVQNECRPGDFEVVFKAVIAAAYHPNSDGTPYPASVHSPE